MKTLQRALILVVFLHVVAAGVARAETASLLGQYTSPHPGTVADLWGYVDPGTNREYALLGERNTTTGVIIVDVTDPTNPNAVGMANNTQGVDMKVWRNYLYVVLGFPGAGGRIFDLTNVTAPQPAGAFESAHTIFIDDIGTMYLSLAGVPREVRSYDLNANPTSPTLLWRDGISEPHQAIVVGTTLYDFHGYQGTRIYDTTARTAPFLLGVVGNGEFHHSGAPTEDGKYLFVTQELALKPRPDIVVWNIEDPANAFQVAQISDSTATVHNLYIIGDYAYVSYYTAGFRIYDISDPTQPVLAAEHDTSPGTVGEGMFRGSYGVYPFTPSGNIYISDTDHGLLVFSFTGASSSIITSFNALHRGDRVVIDWSIGPADELQGFNVYRSQTQSGSFEQINPLLLPPDGEHAYEDTDIEYGKTYWYYLGVVTTSSEFRSRVLGVPIVQPAFALHQNIPNPFNPSTTLPYDLPSGTNVELVVYNVAGQRIRTLVNEFRPAGPNSETWDGRNDRGNVVAAGVYFARLSADGRVDTKRLVLVK